jgi:hypothetical protein
MKILVLTMLMMNLISCRSDDFYHRTEQSSPVFVYTDASKTTIDSGKSYCNVRQYEFGIHRIGPIQGTESKQPIQYCDRTVGFKKYGETSAFWEIVRREIAYEQEGFTRETNESISSGSSQR